MHCMRSAVHSALGRTGGWAVKSSQSALGASSWAKASPMATTLQLQVLRAWEAARSSPAKVHGGKGHSRGVSWVHAPAGKPGRACVHAGRHRGAVARAPTVAARVRQHQQAQHTRVVEAAGQAARLVGAWRHLPRMLQVHAMRPPAPQVIWPGKGAT